MIPSTLHQNLLYTSEFPSYLAVSKLSASHADQAVQKLLDASKPSKAIGISYSVTHEGRLDFICLANTVSVHLIKFDTRGHLPKAGPLASLLAANSPEYPVLVGFQMARTAIQISQTTKLQVSGVDLSRCFHPAREPQLPSDVVQSRLGSNTNRWAVNCLWMGGQEAVDDNVCLQAWLAACIGAGVSASGFEDGQILDTNRLQALEKSVVARLVAQLDLFDRTKPSESVNDFSKGEVDPDGSFRLHNTRFKTRVRCSAQTRVILEDLTGAEFRGNATRVQGKQTTTEFRGSQPALGLRRVRVIGREEPTNSEKACDSLIFLILSGREDLLRSAFTTKFWFPLLSQAWPMNMPEVESSILNSVVKQMQLNNSQKLAVESMVGNEPIVIVHGPPGTGKTTTIAATARLWEHHRYATWIVAHSNVAVKNIAETLAKKQVDFQLLVSKEFYDEWHEHIYEGVADRLIRSDEIPDPSELAKLFDRCQIVLLTLSMLSNPVLQQSHMFKMVPMERLVVDEASQISIFEYLHIFYRFHKSLLKVCFFGDPQQLPPYGKDDVPALQTVFDVKHLMRSSNNVFLDTQYRMPSLIGNFISTYVYDGQLKSQHLIRTPDCLAFIDANKTGEAKAGKSTRNYGEIDAIVNLVEKYYQKKDFCIITPYDAQRSAIQAALEKKNLPWESVFNLDSFQGNEAEYVLISVVRSATPGFLSSVNRMNVMLTRCRKGMVIVSNREFLDSKGSGGGSSTLLGRLLAYWERQHNPQPWVDWREVSAGTASLPGSIRASPKHLQPPPVMKPFVAANVQGHEERARLRTSNLARAFSLAPSLQMTSGVSLSPLDKSTPVWPSLPSRPSLKPAFAGTKDKGKTAPRKESRGKNSASGFIRSIIIHDSSKSKEANKI